MKKVWMVLFVLVLAVSLAGCFGSSQPAQKKEEPAAKGPYVPSAAAQAPTATLLSLMVEGATYPGLAAFKQKLAMIPGVKSVYQQSFNKDATSQLQVEYIGSAQVLADAVQNMSTQQMPIEVMGFDPSKIELRLSPSMAPAGAPAG